MPANYQHQERPTPWTFPFLSAPIHIISVSVLPAAALDFSDTGTSSVRNSGILSVWPSGTDKTDPYEDGRGQQQDTGIQFSF